MDANEYIDLRGRRRPERLEAHPGAVLSSPADSSPVARDSVMRRAPRTVSIATFREDPLYPRIECTVAAIFEQGQVVTPVDVLVGMGLLAPSRLTNWRRGRIPYLEQVIDCNLARLSRLLRILQFHAHDLKLMPSATVYMRWGTGPKQRLRFTKTGDAKLEEAYTRHFVWPGKGPFHSPIPKEPRE